MIVKDKVNFAVIHKNCFACGQQSMNLKFVTDNNGKTHSQFKGDSKFQGYQGVLHGGIITTLLDAAMTHCLFDHGIAAYTGDIHVRFLHPIPCDSLLNIHAEIKEANKRTQILKAEIISYQKVMAWAEAKFCQAKINK